MLPLANESLSFNNVLIGKKKKSHAEQEYRLFREHSTIGSEPEAHEYDRFDKTMTQKLNTVYKRVN